MTTTLPTPTDSRQPEGAVGIACSVLLALLVKTSQKPNKIGLKIIANNVLTEMPLCARLSLFKTNTRPGGTRNLERENMTRDQREAGLVTPTVVRARKPATTST
jgi:hypothetical protein